MMIKRASIYKLSRLFRPILLTVLSLVLALGLAACEGSESGSPGSPDGLSSPTGGSASALQVSFTTDPDPAKPGPVTVIVEVKDSRGQPVTGAQVTVSIRMTNMSHSGIDGQLLEQGSGKYQASGSFMMAGTWRAKVAVSGQGLPATTSTFDIEVR